MTALLADPISKEHVTGPGHAERPERFDAAVTALQELELLKLAPRAATEDEIALCHSPKYQRRVEREVMAGFRELSTGDTAICPRSFDVARHAVGGVLNAVGAVMERKAANAFCIVRPPGH